MKNKYSFIFALTMLLAPPLVASLSTPANAFTIWSDEKLQLKFKVDSDFLFGVFVAPVDIRDKTQPRTDTASFKIKGEIDFVFEGGMGKNFDYGAKVEIRPDSDGVDVDEYYGFFKDKRFGTLYFGTTKSPASKRAVRAPEFYGKDLNAIEGPDFTPLRGSLQLAKDETDIDYDEDLHKIIYYTPRFYGLEFGISYAPDIGLSNSGNSENAYNNTSGSPFRSFRRKNAISANINYKNSFSGFDVSASAGYLFANGESVFEDLSAWNVGAQVGIPLGKAGKLLLGGGFLSAKNTGTNNASDRVYIFGLTHKIGKFAYGIQYRDAKETATHTILFLPAIVFTPGYTEEDREIEFGGSYAFNKYFGISSGLELLRSKGGGASDTRGGRGLAFNVVANLNF